MAKLLTVDQEEITIQPKNGKGFSLKELYRHIGCEFVQLVDLNHKEYMVIDEDGKLNGSAYNAAASVLAHQNKAIHPSDCIVGNAIICDKSQLD